MVSLQSFRQLRIAVGCKHAYAVQLKACSNTVSAALDTDFGPEIFIAQNGFQYSHRAHVFVTVLSKVAACSDVLHLTSSCNSLVSGAYRQNLSLLPCFCLRQLADEIKALLFYCCLLFYVTAIAEQETVLLEEAFD